LSKDDLNDISVTKNVIAIWLRIRGYDIKGDTLIRMFSVQSDRGTRHVAYIYGITQHILLHMRKELPSVADVEIKIRRGA